MAMSQDKKPEEERQELDSGEIVSETFQSLDSTLKSLDTIPTNAEKKTAILLDLLKLRDILFTQQNQAKFLIAINNLSEEIGHAYHTVLAIELVREKVKPESPSFMPPQIMQQGQQEKPSPQVLVQSAPQKGGGLWDFMGTRRMAKAMENIYLAQKQEMPPQIGTSKQVIDILDFGRQLIPEFNRVQKFFRGCIDHLYFFDDVETKERFWMELNEHLNKLAGIIRAFTRTITEYRKELVSDRKAEIAKAALALQMAQAMTQGRGSPMSIDPTSLAMRERTR